MDTWTIRYLNARGALDGYKDRIEAALNEVAQRAAQVAEPIVLDIVVRSLRNRVIPETGHVGFAPGIGMMMLTIDPDNPNLADNMGEPLERMMAHELHHAMRWESVGYGTTLGEVLISEGLAGRFAQELYGGDGELWERAVRREDLGVFAVLAQAHANETDYDHAAWFFGSGGLPRWVGYTLGWEVVGAFINSHPGSTASGLVDAPAEPLLASLGALAKR